MINLARWRSPGRQNFTKIPSGSGLFTPGSQIIYVVATLDVNANQEEGDYESTEDIVITVNYN